MPSSSQIMCVIGLFFGDYNIELDDLSNGTKVTGYFAKTIGRCN